MNIKSESFSADRMLMKVLTKNNLRVNSIDLRDYRPLRPSAEPSRLRTAMIVDLRCPEILRVLRTDPDFIQSQQIYALISNTSLKPILPLLKYQSGVRLDSDISVFSADGQIYDLYKIDNARPANARMVVQSNGFWNATKMFGFNSECYKVPNRRNLMNVTLDGVLYVSEPRESGIEGIC